MNFFLSHHLDRDGYGYGGLKILEGLRWVAPGEWVGVDMVEEGGYSEFGTSRWYVGGPAVVMTVPEWWPDVEARRLVGFTMFESTRMPEGRVDLINRYAEVCLVPCEWCRESFLEQGVRVPVEVVRWGVDPGDFPYMDRTRIGESRPYTFLWSGTPDFRKGWDLVYRAFWAAFGGSEDAQLTLHFRALPRGLMGVNDRNVGLVVGLLGRPGLRDLLRGADCFVFPSRGEGWGSPPREAAATGLPAIATNWGGLAEEIEYWGLPLRVKEMRPAAFGPWEAGEVGEWAEPDFEHLVALMRWCFENREEAARAGERAAGWLYGRTWERTARGICEVVKRGDWGLEIGDLVPGGGSMEAGG